MSFGAGLPVTKHRGGNGADVPPGAILLRLVLSSASPTRRPTSHRTASSTPWLAVQIRGVRVGLVRSGLAHRSEKRALSFTTGASE